MESSAPFPAGRWAAGLGKVRDVVRQEVLRAQLRDIAARLGGPLRVLDVGCGQGTQALHLARDGHDVTGLDMSSELLDRFAAALAAEPAAVRDRVRLIAGPGEDAPRLAGTGFDLVLCHGVLMYLDDPAPMIAALVRSAGDQAAISLLVRNGLGLAMRDGLLGRWQSAITAFTARDYRNRIGVLAHAHTPEDLDHQFAPLDWQRQAWFGVRVFTDHLDGPAPDGREQMIAAEREAGQRDPYRQVAALLHLVYGRVRPASAT